MCDKAFPKDSFKLNYCFNRYKTQGMCYKFVDDFLPMLKLIFDWLITNKKIKKFYNALFAEMIHSFSMKILIISHFLVIK